MWIMNFDKENILEKIYEMQIEKLDYKQGFIDGVKLIIECLNSWNAIIDNLLYLKWWIEKVNSILKK